MPDKLAREIILEPTRVVPEFSTFQMPHINKSFPKLEIMTDEQKLAEWEAINAYVREHHNAYNETGAYLGMKVPGSILEAIKELVDENKALLSLELAQTKQALREAHEILRDRGNNYRE